MIELFPWDEVLCTIGDAAGLAKEMGKRGYKLFRKGADQSIGFMKPKLHNVARFGNNMKKNAQKGWVKIRPVVQPLPGKFMNMTKNATDYLRPKINKLANQTKNAASNYAQDLFDDAKNGYEIVKNTTTQHIVPKIVKPTGNFIKKSAEKVKITIQHVWPNVIKPSANFILSGAAFQAVMDGFRKVHQSMPWTKSTFDDFMLFDFYEIKSTHIDFDM